MIRALSYPLTLLLFSTTLSFAQQSKIVTTTTSDPASVSLEVLFAQADLVAFVKINSGDAENYEDALYKAVVLKSYKGPKVNDVVYFTPFIGYSVGNEYLVFLKKTNKRIRDIVSEDSKNKSLPYDTTQTFHRVMYDGYSIMPVSYECAFEKPSHESCDYAVRFNIKQVQLPKSLKTYPADCEDADISHVSLVKRKAIEPVLESLRNRTQ